MPYTLKIDRDTWLKLSPAESTTLPPNQKQAEPAGTILPISSYEIVGGHIKVSLGDNAQGQQLEYDNHNTWYVFKPDAEILEDGKPLNLLPTSVDLPVPHYDYYDQNNNQEAPWGSCNVTAIAMDLAYLGIPQRHPEMRYPDELDAYCDEHGLDRHSPLDLVKVVEAYGCQDSFSYTSNWDAIKIWIASGLPVVVHTQLTQSGHVILLRGYDETGVWVNDPNGIWTPNGYDESKSGENLHYSWELMYQTVSSDNQLWAHYITKPVTLTSPHKQDLGEAALTGTVQSAPSGRVGFDADTKLDLTTAKLFRQSGYDFCLRYLSLGGENSYDLDTVEAEAILDAGLALMPVQHVRYAGWMPDAALGTQTGQSAADDAIHVGFPPKVNVWLDLEGISPNATAEAVIAYCNSWYDAVAQAGYLPGLYVGANSILDSQQLYDSLKFQHYWHSLSLVPNVAVRGYQMVQSDGGTVHGVGIDKNLTQADADHGQVQWLIRL